eukprot:s3068_g4.t1
MAVGQCTRGSFPASRSVRALLLRLYKLEPEFTPEIEALIGELFEERPAIEKELHVVEKGFYKSTAQKVEEMKATYKVQELPAKLVYTLKSPDTEGEPLSEAGCAAALQRWATGLLDIAGAFMLTPLPQGPDEIVYAIRPPATIHLAEVGAGGGVRKAPKHLVTFEAEEDESKEEPHEVKLAQRLCGELLWLAQRTRPDVSFTVNAMGALISRAAPRCIQVGMKLLAYLQHTQEYALAIYPVSEDLVTFTDSSYAPEGKRSHSGVLVTWKGAPLSWRATRTPYICLSTAESQLTAAIEGLKMALSLGALLEEITRKDLAIHLAIDNQSAIAIAKPTGSTSWRTRHLRVRAAFIREQIQLQKVIVKYVKGQNQLADLLTKSFPRQRLEELVTMWGMGKVCEGAKTAMLRAMILRTLIQSVRAQEPLALDTAPLELYAVFAVACIAVVGLWEFVWLCVDRCCTRPVETRAAKRMRRLREAVQRELETQIQGLDEAEIHYIRANFGTWNPRAARP